MNENEWMNVFHSVMQPCNHSFDDYKLFGSGLPGYVMGNQINNCTKISQVEQVLQLSLLNCS
jgi:hypothetical protein